MTTFTPAPQSPPLREQPHRPVTLTPAEEKMTTMPVIVSAAANLTERQREIVEFVAQFVKDHGYPPSVREIGKATGLKSTSSVHRHLSKLADRSVLARVPNRSRTTLVATVELSAA